MSTLKFIKFLFYNERKSYYYVHTHTPILSNFSEQGWEQSYKQLANMLKENSHIKGVIRSSWFFDPKIKEISPRLAYLRDLPIKNGAKIFAGGPDDSGNALSKSRSRRELFDSGQYKPMIYLLIWPREALIKWAEEIE